MCDIKFFGILEKPYGYDEQFNFSIAGEAFGNDGGGGEYVLLYDGSIGYAGAEDECGRIA